MENDILDSLLDIKYQGPMNNAENLRRAVEIGPKSIDYTRLVSYIAAELKQLCNLEESVNPINSPEDSSSFLMEVSSFLKELGCPYTALITGHLSDRLNKTSDKLLLIDFLLSELMAARMNKINKPDTNKMEIEINESETAKYLKELLMALQFNKPPPNITPAMLFQKVEGKLRDVVNRAGPALVGRPAFTKSLTEKQWIALQEIQNSMSKEYKIRREMLLKRVDVTIQSFQWSDKTKGKDEHIKSVYNKKLGSLGVDPGIDLSDLLAARDDITIIEKTSSASVRKNTQSSVNKVIIGRVPDRGGRPSEQAPPPPEMPSWQQRSGGPGGGRGGGGGGGRGGGRGGNQTQGNNFGGQGRGGYGGQNQTGYGGQSQTGYSGQNQSGYSSQSQSGYGGQAQSQSSYGDQGRGGYNDRRGDYNRDSTGQGSYGGPNRNQGGFGGPNRNSSGGSFGGGQRGDYYGGGGSARGGGGYQPGNQGNQYTSYADQYVQDSYQNQQSGRRGSGGGNQRGQGRSNYNRGGYR